MDILPAAPNKEKASGADDRPLQDKRAKPAQTDPGVRQDITTHDVSAMCRALFPDEPVLPSQRRLKLAERWDKHSRSVQLTETKKNAVPFNPIYDLFIICVGITRCLVKHID